ncbi:Dabb family protein [Ilumatobacter sp.]|uniref:Dabb family protein n=1 Tax=Ilumatobacter sp. TaxID=1967498 RepID=UPI003B51781A
MLRHTVLFAWNDDVTADDVAEIASGLDRMAHVVDGIEAYRHGADLGLAEGNLDYAIVADFSTADAYAAYRDHPDHQDLIATTIRPHVSRRVGVQFELD